MALAAGKVREKPDLACVGRIKAVGEAKLSKGEVYHVVAVEVEAYQAGQSGTFFFLFRPEWFKADFDPASILSTEYVKKGENGEAIPVNPEVVLDRVYRRHIANTTHNDDGKRTGAPAFLQAVTVDDERPDGFEKLAAEFDQFTKKPPKPEEVQRIVAEHVLGREVGYICKQRKDDGELTEQYNIDSFFSLTENEMKRLENSATNGKRRRKLLITWDQS